jgi:hypothetical protein
MVTREEFEGTQSDEWPPPRRTPRGGASAGKSNEKFTRQGLTRTFAVRHKGEQSAHNYMTP